MPKYIDYKSSRHFGRGTHGIHCSCALSAFLGLYHLAFLVSEELWPLRGANLPGFDGREPRSQRSAEDMVIVRNLHADVDSHGEERNGLAVGALMGWMDSFHCL